MRRRGPSWRGRKLIDTAGALDRLELCASCRLCAELFSLSLRARSIFARLSCTKEQRL